MTNAESEPESAFRDAHLSIHPAALLYSRGHSLLLLLKVIFNDISFGIRFLTFHMITNAIIFLPT